MNEFFQKRRPGRRGAWAIFSLVCGLLLGWMFVTLQRPDLAHANDASGATPRSSAEESPAASNSASPQIFGAQLSGACPSGCSIPITINSAENLLTSDGRKLKVNWQVGQIPPDVKVTGVSVSAQVTLDNDKTLDGVISVSPSATSATVEVKGGLLNLNKGRREEVKRARATVTVISNLKDELGRARNVTPSIADGGVNVAWDFTKSPCDTAKEFEVEVKQRPFTLTGNRGKERVSLSTRNVFVRIIGSNLRPSVRDIEATVTPTGRSSIICSVSKTFN